MAQRNQPAQDAPRAPDLGPDSLTNDDLNGDCFIIGSSGERELQVAQHLVIIPPELPAAYAPLAAAGITAEYSHFFLRENYHYLVALGISPPVARRIAYLRYLALRTGLYDPNAQAGQHHCRYREFVERKSTNSDLEIPDWNADVEWRTGVRPKFYDMVCLVAYMFRVRAHHYMDEFDSRYKSIWRKCLYQEDTPGVDWQHIACTALHAVYPDTLDQFYVRCADNQLCSGALVKRVSSLPAGVAGLAALNAGIADLRMSVPMALDYARDAVDHVKQLTELVQGNRWAGSVNRRFYAAPDVKIDENLTSALAAIIRAAIEQFAPNSPLKGSSALKRIAGNAPITGAVVARMVATAVRSEAAAAQFLPKLVEEEKKAPG